jgi:hypothetical protein
MRYHHLFFLASLLLLTSCQAYRLNVQTQYVSRENLASYYVGTPDAEKNCPTVGQRLLIEWNIPQEYLCYPDLKLNIKVRFKNRKEDECSILLKENKGTYLYNVVNDKFHETGGISTYKVEISTEQCMLETWQHPLWAELISFQIPETQASIKQ